VSCIAGIEGDKSQLPGNGAEKQTIESIEENMKMEKENLRVI
jgi:hypothetical protein